MPRAEAAALLDVDPAAGPAEVQRAFLRAARRVHPDTMPDADEAERRAAAAAFDRLLRARDALLAPPPAGGSHPVAAAPEGAVLPRSQGRGLGGSLVVLALLAFLLVLLVTVQQGVRGDGFPSDGTSAPASSPAGP